MSAIGHFLRGFSIISQSGLKRYVLVPFAINLMVFAGAFYWLFTQFGVMESYMIEALPSWLSWLTSLLIPLMLISSVLIFTFTFTAICNFIAAPFNGVLAEKVEERLTGQVSQDNDSIIKDIPRTLKREWTKTLYVLPRTIGFFILFLILPGIGQVLWFLFTAWIMAIQYMDYPFDNHKISFEEMRDQLWHNKGDSIAFGALTAILSMLPIVNLIIMPVAVCGATSLWVEKYRDELLVKDAYLT